MHQVRTYASSAARAPRLLERALGHSSRGDYRLAERCLHKALESADRCAADFVVDRPALWNELGIVCKYLGKLDSAERYYRSALRYARQRPKTAEREFFLANLYHNLGGVEHSRRRFAMAEKYARKGLEIRLKCTPSNRLAVASDRAALAAILDGLHRHGESRKLYSQALKIYGREYGASHPEIAVILNNIGAMYHAKNHRRRAKFYYLMALQMKRRVCGENHPDIAVTMNNLALLYALQGVSRMATLWFRKALCILELTLGCSHPNSIVVRQNMQRLG
jgi:tetratricopeptide (TPR) repeat protein